MKRKCFIVEWMKLLGDSLNPPISLNDKRARRQYGVQGSVRIESAVAYVIVRGPRGVSAAGQRAAASHGPLWFWTAGILMYICVAAGVGGGE